MPNISTSQERWQHKRMMQQQVNQLGPWMLNEQAIMKAKEEAKMAANDRPQLSLYVDDQSAKAQEVGEHV